MKKVVDTFKKGWNKFITIAHTPMFIFGFPVILSTGVVIMPCQTVGFLGLVISILVLIANTNESDF